jgi:hypothetical protein
LGSPERARGPSPSEFVLEGGARGGFVAHGDDMALPVVGGEVRGGGQRSGAPTGKLSYLREADDVLVGLSALGAPGHGGGEDLGEAGQVQALWVERSALAVVLPLAPARLGRGAWPGPCRSGRRLRDAPGSPGHRRAVRPYDAAGMVAPAPVPGRVAGRGARGGSPRGGSPRGGGAWLATTTSAPSKCSPDGGFMAVVAPKGAQAPP